MHSARRGRQQRRLPGDVARNDNKGWSLYGAPWLQPVATGRKSPGPENRQSKPKPLPWFATSCLRRSMVRRGSTVRVRQRALQKPRTTDDSGSYSGRRWSASACSTCNPWAASVPSRGVRRRAAVRRSSCPDSVRTRAAAMPARVAFLCHAACSPHLLGARGLRATTRGLRRRAG